MPKFAREMKSIRLFLTLFMLPVAMLSAFGREPYANPGDAPDSLGKKNIVSRIIAYFEDTNKPKTNKRFDISFIGGPHFSSDTKLGLGLMAAGTYRHDKTDTIVSPSNVSLYGDVSTVGFYLIGIKGTHIFPHDRYRLNYNLYFYSFPTNFWGIGYDMGKYSSNKTSFKQFYFKGAVSALMRVGGHMYVGPAMEFDRIDARKVENPSLWMGQKLSTTTVGAGIEMQLDTRDSRTEPHSGWFVSVEQKFCPSWLGNTYGFSFTSLKASHYREVWKGGVVAGMVSGRFTYGDVPWGMLSTFGGSGTMRGYYEGRYRDKCGLDATLELRQHIWRRSGAAVWAGAATVTPSLGDLSWRKVLPCFGVGYRWEFKQRTNIRLDFGVGRGETAFIFNINEAF